MARGLSRLGRIAMTIVVALCAYVPLSSSGITPISVAEAHPSGCNLALDPTFEHGPSTSIDNWALFSNSGSASLSVVNSPVQSGSRAARVSVNTPGDIYFTTIPEKTGIPVSSATPYIFSVRLLSSGNAKASLRVIEWSSSGAVTADRFLAIGGGTGDWVPLESSFTTTASTAYVSLRLSHHISAGTFTWDDPRLWAQVSGKRCVDVRHYLTQSTSGFKMCTAQNYPATGICLDGWKDSYNEFIQGYTHGIRNYFLHDGTTADRIGIHKNLDPTTGWRCFANPGTLCGAPASGANAQYPPESLNMAMSLPVISNVNPTAGNVTPGAFLVHNWQKFDVRSLDPSNGSQPALLGSIWHREHAFVASSVNFGGNLGIQSNVLVFEAESTGATPTGFNGGERMERYFYIQGYGQIREQGLEDSICRSAPTIANCDGVYDIFQGDAIFPWKVSGDFNVNSVTPYNIVDWW